MSRALLSAAAALACGTAALAEDFSFPALRAQARQRAAAPYAPPPDDLAPFWKNLTYDQHRAIRFNKAQGLWAADHKPFSLDFFHPGWTAQKSVLLYQVDGPSALPIDFDRRRFDYDSLPIPSGVPSPTGYSGWRARTALNSPNYLDEFLVFLGASYFRSLPAHASYGLSARGLSLNSGLPNVPEEFPAFDSFWIQTPQANASSLTAWALLGGPSVSGAYQFIVTPGPETLMEIEAEITLRQPIQQLGLAPFSSMFWFGELTHPKPYDFRPEVHDSDGLLMELASGARHFRPLDHSPDQSRHCVFSLENPRSWSLLQRDRAFQSYQDLEAHYHDRPSARIEPLEGFAKGQLHLIELPTDDETNDNIVLLWEPDPKPTVGTPYHFKYRLVWHRDPAPSGLFAVQDTRCGHPVQRPNQLLFTVDFAKPLHPEKQSGQPPWDDPQTLKPIVATNNPAIKQVHAGLADLSMAHVDSLPLGLGRRPDVHMPQVLRAFFVLEPPADLREMDLSCELQNAVGQAVSERWLYLWKKP